MIKRINKGDLYKQYRANGLEENFEYDLNYKRKTKTKIHLRILSTR